MINTINKKRLIKFEDSLVKLWESGYIKAPVHFSGGNEDQLIEIFKIITPSDWVLSTWRNHYHYLLHTGREGFLYDKIIDEHNSMNIVDIEHKFISSGIVSGLSNIAVGLAYAIKMKGSEGHVYCFLGDGGCDEGWFFEAYRYAMGQDLPVTFVIEDNDRAVETTVKERWGKYDTFMEALSDCPKIKYYKYTPKYPHVGTGEPINW